MDRFEKKKIADLESQLLGEKPWQTKGEIGAYSRPINSLLLEPVDFVKNTKAPLITPETTENLESLIKQRIKDNKFDDPVRKHKQTLEVTTSREVEVNSSKSKVGLAELYEQELIAKSTTSQAKDGPEKEVEKRLHALFRKLDALNDR